MFIEFLPYSPGFSDFALPKLKEFIYLVGLTYCVFICICRCVLYLAIQIKARVLLYPKQEQTVEVA